jgi:phage terminase small subunit
MTVRAPKHLMPETRRWWCAVAEGFILEPHHLRLLSLAAEAWDRCTQARETIAREGLIFTDRFDQPRARPEVAIERDSRLAFARLLRELDLDVDPPAGGSGPPSLRSNRR